MAYQYYPSYQSPYYPPPAPDHLAQLRGQQPFQAPMQGQPVPPQGNTAGNGIIWVQGEEGAKGYLVAPGENRLLMDSENSTFYIKSTDASGMPLPLRLYRTYGGKESLTIRAGIVCSVCHQRGISRSGCPLGRSDSAETTCKRAGS